MSNDDPINTIKVFVEAFKVEETSLAGIDLLVEMSIKAAIAVEKKRSEMKIIITYILVRQKYRHRKKIRESFFLK